MISHEKRIILEKIALAIFLLGVFVAVPFIATNYGPSGMVTYGPGGCVYPEEDLVLTFSATLCNGTYYLNDTNKNGGITISGNNIIINCNQTELSGSNLDQSQGIKIDNSNNVTLSGCILKKYNSDIFTSGSANNIIIKNNNIHNAAHTGILSYGNYNLNISNNTFINASIYLSSNQNGIIEFNNFYCQDFGCGGRNEAIFTTNTNNSFIHNNTINQSQLGIYIYSNNKYFQIQKNQIFNTDRGLVIRDNKNSFSKIEENNFYNNTNDYDKYNLDIQIRNSSFINISYNTILKSIDSSIVITSSNDLNINNNAITMICIENRSNYNGNGQNEPCTYIFLKELYKTWCYADACYSPYNLNKVSSSGSDNINIYSNLYLGDSPVKAFIQGGENISFVDSDTWIRSFEFYNLSNKQTIYIKKNEESIFNKIRNYSTTNSQMLYEGYELVPYWFYGIKKTEMQFYNEKEYVQTLSLFDLSDAFPYNDIYNSSSGEVIASNVNNYSLTLAPGEKIIIGNFTDKGPGPNNPPLEPIVTLSTQNSTNLAEQNLDCEAIISDQDNNLMNVTVYWYKGEVFNNSVNYYNSYPSGTQFSASLSKDLTSIGDGWICGIILTDGMNNSQEGVSNALIITDTSGVQYSSLSNNNSNPYVNNSITWSVLTYSDNLIDTYIFEINNQTNISNTVNELETTLEETVQITQEGTTCIRFFINNTVNKNNVTQYNCITSTIYIEPSNLIYSNLQMTPQSANLDDQVTISVNVSNNRVIEDYTFYNNFSGSWASTTTDINNTNASLSITKQVTNEGRSCAWFEFRDSQNNTNETSIVCVTVAEQTPPVVSTPESSSPGGSSPSSSSPSGSLSATATVTNEVKQITKITNEKSNTIVVDTSSNEKLTINLKKSSEGKSVKIFKIEKPIDIPELDAEIYEYLNIEHDNIPDEDITGVKKTFKVEKTWINNNNLNKEDVKLFRFKEEWTALTTNIINEDNNYIYYEAQSPGLSIFAIGVKKEIRGEVINLEEPKDINKEINNAKSYFSVIFVVLIGFLIGIMVWLKNEQKPIPNNAVQEKIKRYIEDALNAGYQKIAIRHVLKKKGYQANLIRYCFNQIKDEKPVIRYKKTIKANLDPTTQETIVLQLIDYIKREQEEGYFLHEIEATLYHYGHSKTAVKEAVKRIKSERRAS